MGNGARPTKKLLWTNESKNGFFEKHLNGPGEWLVNGFVVAKKRDGFPWRGVVDLQGPNAQTKRCAYPIPKIEDLLIKQSKNALFSIIDLKKAFH